MSGGEERGEEQKGASEVSAGRVVSYSAMQYTVIDPASRPSLLVPPHLCLVAFPSAFLLEDLAVLHEGVEATGNVDQVAEGGLGPGTEGGEDGMVAALAGGVNHANVVTARGGEGGGGSEATSRGLLIVRYGIKAHFASSSPHSSSCLTCPCLGNPRQPSPPRSFERTRTSSLVSSPSRGRCR